MVLVRLHVHNRFSDWTRFMNDNPPSLTYVRMHDLYVRGGRMD